MPALKYSRQREAILTFLRGRTDHPTADTIYTCLRQDHPNISLGTVYRNLSLLEDIGEIVKIYIGSDADHYDGNAKPHQHFICTKCHRVYDMKLDHMDAFIQQASENAPGRIDSCTASFYGVCTDCLPPGQ